MSPDGNSNLLVGSFLSAHREIGVLGPINLF